MYYNVLHVNSHAMEKVEKSGIKDSVCVSVYVCNIFRWGKGTDSADERWCSTQCADTDLLKIAFLSRSADDWTYSNK